MISPYPLIMLSLVMFGIVTKLLGQVLVLADGAIIAALVTLNVITMRSEAASETVQLV